MGVLICSTDTTFTDLLLQNLSRCGFVTARQLRWSACCEPAPAELAEEPSIILADLCCPAPDCWHGLGAVQAQFPDQPALFLAHAWPGRALAEQCAPGRILRKPLAMNELLSALRDLKSQSAM